MRFLLAFVITMLAACGGWLVWSAGRSWSAWRRRRHQLQLARIEASAQVRRTELAARLREQELANEMYQDFLRRQPPAGPGPADDGSGSGRIERG